MMISPKPLKQGDKVALIAPSGPVNDERRQGAIKAVENMGFLPVTGKSFFLNEGYLAGSDQIRAEDINEAFSRKDIKGIFCVRGGYGSQRIIHSLNKEIIKENPKFFAGYSDITALHIFLGSIGLKTFHSPMAGAEFATGIDEFSEKSFLNYAKGNFPDKISNPNNKGLIFSKNPQAKGQLAGGNLCVIASSIGTEYELDFSGKIIFLEEVGEEPYKIDRMMNQLANSGQLKMAEGFILGHFTNCEAKSAKGISATQLIVEFLESLGKPWVCGLSCGHELPNITLPLGEEIEITEEKILIGKR